MNFKRLTCFLFNDLEPWEREAVEPILESLSKFAFIETVWVTDSQRRHFKSKPKGDFWIVSRNWLRALDFLSAKNYRSGNLFVSVLNGSPEEKRLYDLSFQAFFAGFGDSTTLLTYSPLEYRFFRDIKKIPESQLKLASLALPLLKPLSSPFSPREKDKLEVGTFCDFSVESNINFLLGVAHFVTQRNSKVHFNILGRGPLYGHFSKMICDLDLSEKVSIVETVSDSAIGSLDLFLYSPLRNHHFLPVMLAGAYKVPVISVGLPGIESFITPGRTGFVIPSFEIQAMGEKIIEMLDNSELRAELGLGLKNRVESLASIDLITEKHREIFFSEKAIEERTLRKAS
jgi:glycosyltransferase involved in cell wall biosynthesis